MHAGYGVCRGFLAVFCFQSSRFGFLHAAGVVPFAPFTAATKPAGRAFPVILRAFFADSGLGHDCCAGSHWQRHDLAQGPPSLAVIVCCFWLALLVVSHSKGMAFDPMGARGGGAPPPRKKKNPKEKRVCQVLCDWLYFSTRSGASAIGDSAWLAPVTCAQGSLPSGTVVLHRRQ